MGSIDEKQPSILKKMTNIIFRPKTDAEPKMTPEGEQAKKAEQEEKRKKILEAYAKHCEEQAASEPTDKPPPKPMKYRARDFNE